MSIEPLVKVSLIGPSAELNKTLDALQVIGIVHLLSPSGEALPAPGSSPARVVLIDEAIRYLHDVAHRRPPAPAELVADPGELIEQVLANRQRRRDVLDRIEQLKEDARALAPWGEFSWPDPEDLGGLRLWLYQWPVSESRRLTALPVPWQEINRDSRFSYVAVIADEPPVSDGQIGQPLTPGRKPLSQIQLDLEVLGRELEDLDAERLALTRWLRVFERERDELEDAANLKDVCEAFADDQPLFRIRGWVPARLLTELEQFAEEGGVLLVAERTEDSDQPPTLLSNPPQVRSGQSMLGFFALPGYRTWDPSALVLFSFVLFFSMIVADAGYALVLGALTGYYYRRMGSSAGLLQFRRLCVLLCSGTLAYGVLAGSYFGLSPAEGSLLAALVLVDLNDYQTMMRLSVLIGAAHLLTAILASALRADASGRLLATGWGFVTIGGVTTWLGTDWLADLGMGMIALGLLLVLMTADDRPVTSVSNLARRIGHGLLEARQVTRLFGDVLSYLRLFALGLASSSLALAFNDMAARTMDNVAGIGLLLAIVISVFGHGINLTLAVVGGFIHGLRLNFIEFLSWGISEEGYRFMAFKRKGDPEWTTA